MFGLDLITVIGIVAFICAALWLVSDEMFLGLLILTVLGFLGCYYKFPEAISVLRANPYTIVGILLFYLVAGAAWAFFKWYLFVRKRVAEKKAKIEAVVLQHKGWDATEVRNVLKDYATNGVDKVRFIDNAINNIYRDVLRSYVQYNEHTDRLADNRPAEFKQPNIVDYKDKFITWITFWPFSAVSFMCADLVRELAISVYNYFGKQLQAISDKMWRD
jgi:hypothetical protein